MSEKSVTNYTVLHLRFKLRVPPDVLLAHSRNAATIIASVEGLIWKIWILREEESGTRVSPIGRGLSIL
jgi:hypothetical protein